MSVYSSKDYGNTWTETSISGTMKHFDMSDNGQYQWVVGTSSPGYKLNITYDYIVPANSDLQLFFTANPPFYTDSLFNSTVNFTVCDVYGVINHSSAYSSYTSSTPTFAFDYVPNNFVGNIQVDKIQLGEYIVYKTT